VVVVAPVGVGVVVFLAAVDAQLGYAAPSLFGVHHWREFVM
jgi:hypothetical protein